jgi:ribosomal protein L37AE/L43A
MDTDSVNKDTEGEKPSMMKFYLEPKVHKVEIAFESLGPSYNQHARVKIARILVKGTEKGGAVECKSCEEGSIANSKLYMCKKCQKGF